MRFHSHPILSHQHQALPQQCAQALYRHRLLITGRAVATATAAAAEDEETAEQQRCPVTISREFNCQLQRLAAWRSQYGCCHVPRCAADAAGLSDWVTKIRQSARKGQLAEHHRQQLDALEFVWKPDVVEAKWHANYHTLRCWLSTEGGGWQLLKQHHRQQLRQQQQQQQDLEDIFGVDAAAHVKQQEEGVTPATTKNAFEQQQRQQQQHHQQQHDQVQLPPDIQEAYSWLLRQVQLYQKLKLTQLKVTLLRQLGVKLHRQAGLTKPNLHPILQGQKPSAYQRRPIVVDPATPQGRSAVGRLLAAAKDRRQQQQQQHQEGDVDAEMSQQAPPAASRDADVEFMYQLAELQKWKKRYGSCHVPVGVFDRSDLAGWLMQLRQLKAAAGDVTRGCVSSSSSGTVGRFGSSSSTAESEPEENSALGAAARAAISPTGAQQQASRPQQHHRSSGRQGLSPKHLKPWHIKELDALRFDWSPNQEQEEWHARFHQLRHFKQIHHHINVASHHAAAAAGGAAAAAGEGGAAAAAGEGGVAAAAAGEGGAAAQGTSATTAGDGDTWLGLAQWVALQQQLLGEASIEVELSAAAENQNSKGADGSRSSHARTSREGRHSSSSSSGGGGGGSSSKERILRRRLLRSLGVKL